MFLISAYNHTLFCTSVTGSCGGAFQQPGSLLCVQIKRRASEALPELLRPVTPITSFEGTRPQDPSGIFGLVSNLEQLDVDDWEF